jgi:hypothetical protein
MKQLFIKDNQFIISKSIWTQLRKEKVSLYHEQKLVKFAYKIRTL